MSRYRLRDIVREITANAAMAIPKVRETRVKNGRAKPREAVAAFSHQLEVLRAHAGGLEGKTILEIGPGDVMPMGLLSVAYGAKQYVGVDRFGGNVFGASARAFYADMLQKLPDARDRLISQGLEPTEFPWSGHADAPSVRLLTLPIEDAIKEVSNVDVVFSYNVVEHLNDVAASFKNLWQMLRPGGVMIHRVDFAPHACWASYDNPLTFLSVPQPLWHAMGTQRGIPNRVRYGQVQQILDDIGFEHRTVEIGRFERHFINSIRPSLTARLKDETDESLEVQNAVIVARRKT